MADSASVPFDFDAWVQLHQSDPAEFEAKRQATLMLELSRGDTQEQRDAARAALARYEHAAIGLEAEARAQLSATMMAESMTGLTLQLQSLSTNLNSVTADLTALDDR